MKASGRVYLVGAGPGAADLITLRGLRLLQGADVVLYDRLVGGELLAEARSGAELVDVGKSPGGGGMDQEEINALLVARACAGAVVVRLKGGDPSLFGRSGEEQDACRAAGVKCQVVPGVSSVLAAAAALEFPLTRRGTARSVALWTAQTQEGRIDEEGLAKVAAADTLVVFMGRAALPSIVHALLRFGRAPQTPAACISAASLPHQREVRTTLGNLVGAVEAANLETPMLLVIGSVAG